MNRGESIMKASWSISQNIIHTCTHMCFSPWGPCCPKSVNVTQVTQAMSNVTWTPAKGARSYITTLMSSRGEAKCHTLDTHCLMGCITCGTNYSVNMEAISSTGHMSECSYQGFSTSEDKHMHIHTQKYIYGYLFESVKWLIRLVVKKIEYLNPLLCITHCLLFKEFYIIVNSI